MDILYDKVQQDLALFSRISEGDEGAFRQLFFSYIAFLRPAIIGLVKEAPLADDIIQESFLRIWIYRDRLQEVRNPRGWILRIAYNQAFTRIEKERRYFDRNQKAAAGLDDISNETEQQLALNGLKKELAQAVRKLPPRQREVYRLIRTEGLTAQEVSEKMGITVQTVKNTLGKALQEIRAYLERSGYPIPAFLLFFPLFF